MIYWAIVLGLASAPSENWRYLRESVQGPLYVDIGSVRRQGRYAFIVLEGRMSPPVRREMKFDCQRHRVEVEVFTMRSNHDLGFDPAGTDWIRANDHETRFLMRTACRTTGRKPRN